MRCWDELNSLLAMRAIFGICGNERQPGKLATPLLFVIGRIDFSTGETTTIRSSSRDILPSLLSPLMVTYSFLQEIKP